MSLDFTTHEESLAQMQAREDRLRNAYQLVREKMPYVQPMDMSGSGSAWQKLAIKVADRVAFLAANFTEDHDGQTYRLPEQERNGEMLPEEIVTMTRDQVSKWAEIEIDLSKIPGQKIMTQGLRAEGELLCR